MLFFRRLPGIIYNHRYATSSLTLLLLVFIYLLFHWGFVCSNIEPWNHVKHLCDQYRKNLAVGDLCHPLCEESRIGSFSCQTFHAGKEAVFSAVKDDNTRLVFKLARQMDEQSMSTVYWVENGVQKYPSEAEFTKMIIDHINNRLNTSISPDHAASLGRYSQAMVVRNGHDRHLEMQELWTLLQDNEFLLASLYSGSDVFPRVLGTCGQYFALEYLEPAIEGHVITITAWLPLKTAAGLQELSWQSLYWIYCRKLRVLLLKGFPFVISNLPISDSRLLAVR